MSTFFITGVAGFIGSSLADKLLSENHKIVGIDNFDPFYARSIKESNLAQAQLHPNFTLVEGDIRDVELMTTILKEHQPEAVVHLAAKAGVRPSIQDPRAYFDVNLNGTLALLEAMNATGLKKLVFASSSSVYGNNEKKPFSETDPVDHPISPYAASKKAGELMCHTFHHLYAMDVFCLRFFTVYGPRQRPDLAINKFSHRIMQDEPIPVFGDGSSARDYTFIADIVAGIQAAIERVSGFEVINLGESQTITLADLIATIETAIGKKAIIDRQGKQAGDVDITYADISKARKLLDYNPQYTKEQGIASFVDWKRKQLTNA